MSSNRESEAGAGTFNCRVTRHFAHVAFPFVWSCAVVDAVAELSALWTLAVGSRLPRMAHLSATSALPGERPWVWTFRGEVAYYMTLVALRVWSRLHGSFRLLAVLGFVAGSVAILA